jgi:uncharacterized protein YaaN involved in tellurite resistance
MALTPTRVAAPATQSTTSFPQTTEVLETEISSYMNNIPPEYRDEVLAKKDQIVFGDISTIQKFGSEIATASAKFTAESTNAIKLGNAGDIGDKINEMMRISKKLDPSKLLDNKDPGFFGKLFGKTKDKIIEFKNDQMSINESLKQLGNSLLADAKSLENENKKLEGMYQQNSENIKLYDVILAAGMIKKHEIESQIIPRLVEKAQESGKPEDANEVRAGQNFLRQLDVRIANINSARSVAILQAPALKDMQDSNAMQIENIQTMITIGLPAWHQQIAMYISQMETRRSVEITNQLSQGINETMRATSALQGQNAVMIAEAANKAIIDVETIQTIQTELFSSMDKVKQINDAGKTKRAETAQKLLSMESELKQKLLAS